MKRSKYFYILLLLMTGLVSFLGGFYTQSGPKIRITREIVSAAEKIIGLEFTEAKNDSMLENLEKQLMSYESLRRISLPNEIPPALIFNPIPVDFHPEKQKKRFRPGKLGKVEMPNDERELAFLTVAKLARLIKSKKISSTALTKLYLDRLKKYGDKLECVVTLTESLALEQSRRADREISLGRYRGALHGIPYGAKDLFATRGIKTTWGSVPFKEQIFDEDASVIDRLGAAGAVLVAKLSMGELAWGDVWFGGKTKNPWNPGLGSSGSSAGSASATSAGLVAFSIGTETWGSIVSPSTVCGTAGLRPTYGRVSRSGAMALSWSMDKIGPICRTAEDCAIVFNEIYGPDGIDQTVADYPFYYDAEIDMKKLRIGYLHAEFDSLKENKSLYAKTLETLTELGAKLLPVSLPEYPVNELSFILNAEAGAAFDDLTRSGGDDLMTRQIKDAWPNLLRASRLIPAVEYIQANRHRYVLIQEMEKLFSKVDCFVSPPFEGNSLLLTNLTGHPAVVIPNGFGPKGLPTSVVFTGKLFDEGKILAVAARYQNATEFHLKHPTIR